MYIPVIKKVLQEQWPIDVFNAQKETDAAWVVDHGLLPHSVCFGEDFISMETMKTLLVLCKNRKEIVKKTFIQHMDNHFRLVADLSGFKIVDDTGGNTKVQDSCGFVKGMIRDASDKNIQRLCWILYYASGSAYKNIFGMEMNAYYEKIVMNELKISYQVDTKKKQSKGCISQYINKLLNNYRSNIKDSLTKNKRCPVSVCVNAPPNSILATTKKPQAKNANSTFWIGHKKNLEVTAANTEDGKNPMIWSWV